MWAKRVLLWCFDQSARWRLQCAIIKAGDTLQGKANTRIINISFIFNQALSEPSHSNRKSNTHFSSLKEKPYIYIFYFYMKIPILFHQNKYWVILQKFFFWKFVGRFSVHRHPCCKLWLYMSKWKNKTKNEWRRSWDVGLEEAGMMWYTT